MNKTMRLPKICKMNEMEMNDELNLTWWNGMNRWTLVCKINKMKVTKQICDTSFIFFLKWDFKTHITYETNSDSTKVTLTVWEKEFSFNLIVRYFHNVLWSMYHVEKKSSQEVKAFFKHSKYFILFSFH